MGFGTVRLPLPVNVGTSRRRARSPRVNRREFLGSAAVGGLLLATSPDAFARRLGGLPVALVTADTESHVAVVRLDDGRILRRIATPAGPRSIESVGRTAVVAHTAAGPSHSSTGLT